MSVCLQTKSVIFLDSRHQLAAEVPENAVNCTLDQYNIHDEFTPKSYASAQTSRRHGLKRKRPPDFDDEETEDVGTLEEALEELLKSDVVGKLSAACEDEDDARNARAHRTAIRLASLDDNRLAEKCYELAVHGGSRRGFHVRVENPGTKWRSLELDEERYLLPPRCAFLMSDLRLAPRLLSQEFPLPFDLVVADPPWANKSVKRQRRYRCVENEALLGLPLRSLLAPRGLLAVWVTNCARHRRWLEDVLLPAWGLRPRARWLWLKVTARGRPVLPLDFAQRRPHEALLLAAGPQFDRDLEPRVLLSVPSSVHSRKPPLLDALRPLLLPADPSRPPRCLELFARDLHEGWSSWGNEPLRFQHASCFRLAGAVPPLLEEAAPGPVA